MKKASLLDLGAERTQRGRNSMSFYVCRQRRALLLHGQVDVEAAKLGIEVLNVGTDKAAVAWMGAPMITGERVLGMIAVQHFDDELAYDENDLNLVQAIANQAGIALANARLYQLTDVQLSERVEELTALSSISQELNSTLEPDHIFGVVIAEALKVTGAEYGFISMVNEETGLLNVRATQGLTADAARQVSATPIHVGEGITGRAAETGQPVLVNDVSQTRQLRRITARSQSGNLGAHPLRAVGGGRAEFGKHAGGRVHQRACQFPQRVGFASGHRHRQCAASGRI